MSAEKPGPLKLRPHHGLCVQFFRGMGYDEEFVSNMTAVVERLGTADPVVLLTIGPDVLCGKCPHNREDVCDTAEKVERYDRAVLRLCGLAEGDTIKWSTLRELAYRKIIAPGRLREVCGDCNWKCSRASRQPESPPK